MDVEMLRGLCAIPAVSGSEEEIRNWIRGQVSAYAEEIREDALGNLIVRQKGKKAARTTLMVTAHMDESGLMVTHITEEGFLKVTGVGGIRPETLCGSPVRINGLSGIIGGKPVHLMDREERAKPVPLDQLSIDIGASSKEEAEKVVSIGDVATLDSLFEAEDEIVRARALDSRVGCALLMELLRETPEYDRIVVFSVLGQIGFQGAGTAAYTVNPQAVLAVGAAECGSFSGEDKKESCRLGEGPAVFLLDPGTIYDREYISWAFEEAEKQKIPVQIKKPAEGRNETAPAHISRGGARPAAVAVPCRYLQGPLGMMSCKDFENTAELLAALTDRIAGSPAVR